MYTRLVEIRTKTGKARDFSSTLNDRVLPILKKQPGFMDEITLVSRNDPDRILALSFWDTQDHAERYNHEQYPTVREMITPLLATEPRVETFDVDTSTTHKIARGKAA